MKARIAPPPIWPGPQLGLGVVGVRHVLACQLGDRVRPARFADRADRGHVRLLHVEGVLAEDLAGREVDDALHRVGRRERRLEHVVGPDHVDPHRSHGALEHRVDARDPGAVDDVRRVADGLSQAIWIEHVSLYEAKAGMVGQVGRGERIPVQVVDRDDVVRADEAARESRADEAGPARDHDPLALQRHAASLAPARDRAIVRGVRLVAVTALALLALASASAGSGSVGATVLTITIWQDEHKPAHIGYGVACRPARGTLPRAAAACTKLAAGGAALFAPTPPDQACIAIYGGPQRAIVSGTVDGRRVWVSLRRRDGCEVERWRRLSFLLPVSVAGPS
jgi:hypothetical protein